MKAISLLNSDEGNNENMEHEDIWSQATQGGGK
jgi:hypothetical protein